MRTLLLVVLLCVAIWACGARATKKIKREPIILIPGFASSRLMAWKLKKCGSGFNINIGDRVWLDSSHVLYDSFREGCWSDCMMLNPHDQSDPPDCKLRPVSSIEAISELDPGQITGPLSSIFRNVIDLLSGEYDYDTTNLAAAPYDWRLPPNILEERDRYFSSLKATIEEMVHFNQKPAIIIAHSMGNNVFLYFTEWVKQQYPTNWQKWFDTHISSFFAVAPPLLGAPQTIRGALSGVTFGLPLSEAAVRNFMATYGSGPWMFPVPDPSPEIASRLQGGWPHDPVIVDYYTKLESKRYPIETITNGTLFSDASQYDPKSGLMNAIQKKFYERQTINPLKEPPVRPPVKDIYCIYGINEKTELGYHYRVVDEAFRLKKKIFEDNGGEVYSTTSLLNRKEYISHSKWGKSGDGTVPYNSLSWCHTWHTGNVTLTETPTVVDTSSRLQGLQQLLGIEKLVYGRYKFDSISEENGRVLRTSVIELERQNHRDIIRSPNLIDVLKREIDPRTDIEYLPFEEVDIFPATVEDLKRHSMEDIKQMISILQRETEKREVLNSKEDKKDTSDSDNTEEIQEKIENDKSNQKMFIDEEAERDEHGRIILRGNNTEGLEEYLVDVRDDDEGSEFKTKAQGGIL